MEGGRGVRRGLHIQVHVHVVLPVRLGGAVGGGAVLDQETGGGARGIRRLVGPYHLGRGEVGCVLVCDLVTVVVEVHIGVCGTHTVEECVGALIVTGAGVGVVVVRQDQLCEGGVVAVSTVHGVDFEAPEGAAGGGFDLPLQVRCFVNALDLRLHLAVGVD